MINVNRIVKVNFVDEVIFCGPVYKIFILEKGLGVLYVDDKQLDFRMGRTYVMSNKSILKINGFISSGFLVTVADVKLFNFINEHYLRSYKIKLIDLSWPAFQLLCKEIKSIGDDFVVEKPAESKMFLSAILGIDLP